MITGTVNADYEAVIRLFVHGPSGTVHEVNAIIDTGFNGFLTLPPALVTTLGLMRRSRGRALLANGREELFDIYGVTVLWDGQQRYVEADAVDTTPLVGMSLLDGDDLYIQVAAGGQVVVQAPGQGSPC
jgi:clan AA aspartic protease